LKLHGALAFFNDAPFYRVKSGKAAFSETIYFDALLCLSGFLSPFTTLEALEYL
jgi:hypothetical protein